MIEMSRFLIPMLAQAEQSAGMWAPIVGFLQAFLLSAGILGVLLGATMIVAFGHDEEKQELGRNMIGGASMGLAIGLLALPIYNLVEGWLW